MGRNENMSVRVNIRTGNELIREFIRYYTRNKKTYDFEHASIKYSVELTADKFDFYELNLLTVEAGEDLTGLFQKVEKKIIGETFIT